MISSDHWALRLMLPLLVRAESLIMKTTRRARARGREGGRGRERNERSRGRVRDRACGSVRKGEQAERKRESRGGCFLATKSQLEVDGPG